MGDSGFSMLKFTSLVITESSILAIGAEIVPFLGGPVCERKISAPDLALFHLC